MYGGYGSSIQGVPRLYANSRARGGDAAFLCEKCCAALCASLGYVGAVHATAVAWIQKSPSLPKLCDSVSGALPHFPNPSWFLRGVPTGVRLVGSKQGESSLLVECEARHRGLHGQRIQQAGHGTFLWTKAGAD